METTIAYTSMSELVANLDHIRQSPKEGGRVEMIVARPIKDERRVLEAAELSPERGLHGDNWAKGCWKSLPDGRPDPNVCSPPTTAPPPAMRVSRPAATPGW